MIPKLKENLTKKEIWRFFFICIVLAFILFGNGILGQFVYDDDWVINKNPIVSNFSNIFNQFVLPYHYLQPETGLYRPLTLISFSFNYIFGNGPTGFHVINILLHALCAFLIFNLIFKIFNSKRLSYLTAILFLFLPIHVETVTFISGRADILAFLFSLLAFWFLVEKKYWLSSAMFLLALFSKESALAVIPIMVFWIWFYERDNIKNLVKKLTYYMPSLGIYALLRYITLKNFFLSNDADLIYNPLKFTDWLSRFYTALKVMTVYLEKTFWPVNLSADYSFNQIPVIHSPLNFQVILGLIILTCLVYVIFWNRTKSGIVALGSIIFLSSYFIISNFIFSIGTIMAERTFYFPSFGAALIAVFGVENLIGWRFKKIWLGLFGLVMVVYGVIIMNRNPVWHDRLTLYTDMVKTAPQSVHAKTNLGVYYIQNNHWDEGKKLILETYAVDPEHLPILDSLGIIAEHEKRYPDAETFYLRALNIRPHYATALSNLGRMYFQLGQYEKSADIYWREFSYKQEPGPLLVYAMSKSKLGKYDEAIDIIKRYYTDQPQDLRLKFALGYAYYKKGDRVTADKYFKESKNPSISDEEFIKTLENF